MENTLTLKAPSHPVFQLHTEKAHPQLSLRRVLWVKFLRWIDKSSLHTLRLVILRALTCVFIALSILIPQFVLGLLAAVATPKIAGVAFAIMAFLYFKVVLRWIARLKVRNTGNQNTFHGVGIERLADYLMEHQSFKMDAMNALAITQPKHQKIASILERAKILIRGEANSRILNTISREELVNQLKNNFPLTFDETRKEWVKRDGTWELFLRDQENKEKKEEEEKARLEKREERVKRREEELKQESPLSKLFTQRSITV